MHKPYLLALDLGTASLGYVAFALDKGEEPQGILDLGVRVFPDGREPKTGEPLAVQRRLARGIRRNRDRGQNRVRRLVRELIETGLMPDDKQERRSVFTGICPYSARHQAATDKVGAHTLGRALFHLGRRRGFQSNRLTGDTEENEYKARISDLREKLNRQNLGTYLHKIQQQNRKLAKDGKPQDQQALRFRQGETAFYADRQMYRDEFARIKQVQSNDLLTDEQWNRLEETIFWQYPLKPVPKGKCRFYPEETRAHIDLPLSHQYRIYQEVNNLRYTSGGVEHELNRRQREMLYDKLHHQQTMTFNAMVKQKDHNKAPYFPSDARFNLDVGSRSGKLLGNKVLIDLGKPDMLGKLAEWGGNERLCDKKLNDIVHHLIEPVIEIGGKAVIQEGDALIDWLLAELPSRLTREQAENVCKYRFKRDTAAVSRKFMEQIVPVLRDTGNIYSEAVRKLTDDNGNPLHHSDFEIGEVLGKLPYYGKLMPESVWGAQPEADRDKAPDERDEDAWQHGKIANPSVHVALNQLRVVVNRIIDRLGGPPARIHIELTRDLKNSRAARAEIERRNRQNKQENNRIRTLLQEEFNIAQPSRSDFQKIKLWEELEKQGARFCVFSGNAIPACKLFNGEVEIEHIVPFSRCYDDGMQNKTLAFKQINNIKGNQTPHEAFAHDLQNYQGILARALAAFGPGPKLDRFKENAFERFYGEDNGGDMIARQLNDTRYISRKARQYLSCLCGQANVVSVKGMMTATLRDVWQLNRYKNRAEGNYREDHRHHIVDAFVVGLTSRSLIQQLGTVRSAHHQDKQDLYHFLKARVKDIPELKKQLMERLDHVVASYKPDHTQAGSMFYDTAYGIGTDEQGNRIGITRKAPARLSFDEIFQIRSHRQRLALLKYLTGKTDIPDKKALKAILQNDNALHKKAAAYSQETGIKKLRIQVQNNSIQPIESARYKGKPYKGYAKNSYAYCDIWQVPERRDRQTGKWHFKYQGDFVGYADLAERKNKPEAGRPHPAAKKLMRLYKQDSLKFIDKETGEISYMRVAGYSVQKNKLDIRPNLQAKNTGQNFVSVNILFKRYNIHKLRY